MKWNWRWFAIWSIVYSLNIPVLYILSGRGPDLEPKTRPLVGISFALAVMWLLGLAICQFVHRIRELFILGAVLVAISQFFPILQIISGSIAKNSWENATDFKLHGDGYLSEIAGFGITVLTGQMLFVLCLFFGYFAIRILKDADHRPGSWFVSKWLTQLFKPSGMNLEENEGPKSDPHDAGTVNTLSE